MTSSIHYSAMSGVLLLCACVALMTSPVTSRRSRSRHLVGERARGSRSTTWGVEAGGIGGGGFCSLHVTCKGVASSNDANLSAPVKLPIKGPRGSPGLPGERGPQGPPGAPGPEGEISNHLDDLEDATPLKRCFLDHYLIRMVVSAHACLSCFLLHTALYLMLNCLAHKTLFSAKF